MRRFARVRRGRSPEVLVTSPNGRACFRLEPGDREVEVSWRPRVGIRNSDTAESRYEDLCIQALDRNEYHPNGPVRLLIAKLRDSGFRVIISPRTKRLIEASDPELIAIGQESV